MKVYKVELMVIDIDNIGYKEIKDAIESTKYPNYCISPKVISTSYREVDWSDEHPLNNINLSKMYFNELFK